MTQTEMQNAVKWFNQYGIEAKIVNDEDVAIMVNDLEIFVSSSEVIYRAELWESES